MLHEHLLIHVIFASITFVGAYVWSYTMHASNNLKCICMAACAREEAPKAPQYAKWINGIGTIIQEDDMFKIDLLPSITTWLETPQE